MTSQSPSSQDQLTFPWQDSERSIEKRVELLLADMSLEEKVAQLGSKWVGNEIENLRLSSSEIPTDGEVTASVRVRNTGAQEKEEIVQLCLQDVVASATRPVKQLARFNRVCLSPGEEAEVSFRLDAGQTAFTGGDLQRIVEPGEVDILVGRSASDLSCQARVRLTGPTRVVGHKHG
jgi:Fibronectin type III-like domain